MDKVGILHMKKFLCLTLNLPLPNIRPLDVIFSIGEHSQVSCYWFYRLEPYLLLGFCLSKLKTFHPSICQWTDSRNCEGSEILPYLQANKLACRSFTDARRHETPGLETGDHLWLVAIVLARVSACAPVPRSPVPVRKREEGHGTPTHATGFLQKTNPKLGEPDSCIMSSMSTWPLPQQEALWCWRVNKHAETLEGGTVSITQGCSLENV